MRPQDGRIDGEKEAVWPDRGRAEIRSAISTAILVDLEIVARKLSDDGRRLCLGSKPIFGIGCGLLAHVTTPIRVWSLRAALPLTSTATVIGPAIMIVYAAAAPPWE
jgi:hypothetical protein